MSNKDEKIRALPTVDWCPLAALASANERVPDKAKALVCIWVDEDEKLRCTVSSESEEQTLWMLEKAKMELLFTSTPHCECK
jgi:hypothetical protein